jgi:hypothetical protein
MARNGGTPREDLTGQRFGRLVVLSRCVRKAYRDAEGNVYATAILWVCKCDCGRKKLVHASALRGNGLYSTKSCGCMKRGPRVGVKYGPRKRVLVPTETTR